MANGLEKKNDVVSLLTALDMEKGIPIFSEELRTIAPNTRFLIVSFGGTGGYVLKDIKKHVKKSLPKDEYSEKVSFLAIDSDITAQYAEGATSVKNGDGTVTVDGVKDFEDSEFLWLDNSPAKNAINTIPDYMREWMNPNLPATIKSSPKYLDSYGASNTRQIGRLLLSPQETYENFSNKLLNLVRHLTNNNADNLKIFIVSGISGGTGSGIVVDASYLIRYLISDNCGLLHGGVESRTSIDGIILLPPTGTSDSTSEIAKGNRNGYAALKEIDHFMTVSKSNEAYDVVLGGNRVRVTDAFGSAKNIFDTCYLIDGQHTFGAVGNPREMSKQVVSSFVLDMITSSKVSANGTQPIATVDSILSNTPAVVKSIVSSVDHRRAPRNANYVYSTLGYGTTLIPIELMKSYVAYQVYTRMKRAFDKCSQVSEKDVKNALSNIFKFKGSDREGIKQLVKETEDRFRDIDNFGPFYVVNFLHEIIDRLERERTSISFPGLKQNYINFLISVRNAALKLNSDIFEVYVPVIDQMGKYLERQQQVLFDSELIRSYCGSTYTFTPIDLSNIEGPSKIVKEYLDGLINGKRTRALTEKLVSRMLDKREEWTGKLDSSTNKYRYELISEIRKFWNESIDEVVDGTVESYLIKLYSNDAKAEYEETPNGEPTPKTDAALKKAAAQIVSEMFGATGGAVPVAELQNTIIPQNTFCIQKVLLVPKSATHLKKYIEDVLNTGNYGKGCEVALSLTNSSITGYSHYLSLPAFMFKWTKNAETNYETDLRNGITGIHMSETKGGELWRDLPNLVVEDIWPMLSHDCPREHAIGQRAKSLFDRAKALGLAHAFAPDVAANVLTYKVFSVDEKYRPDPALYKAFDVEPDGIPAKAMAKDALDQSVTSCAQELYKLAVWENEDTVKPEMLFDVMRNLNVGFSEKVLQMVDTVNSPYVVDGTSKPEDWDEKMAYENLRIRIGSENDLRGTVDVLEKLSEMIRTAQLVTMKRRLFAYLYADGAFKYSAERSMWIYDDPDLGETDLCQIKRMSPVQKVAKVYFLFNAYLEHYNDVYNAVLPSFITKFTTIDGTTEAEIADNEEALAAALGASAKEMTTLVTVDRKVEDQMQFVVSGKFKDAAGKAGYSPEAIIGFYKALIDDFDINYYEPLINDLKQACESNTVYGA